MVRLTLNKPYTLHARSIDRITGTPSDYKLNLIERPNYVRR